MATPRRTLGYVSQNLQQGFSSQPLLKMERFTATSTWTCPSGVSYAIVTVKGGGGGSANDATSGGTGGTSSFAGSGITTLSATGGQGITIGMASNPAAKAGNANSGKGAHQSGSDVAYAHWYADEGQYRRQGIFVTAGTAYTVTVGNGGTAGTGGAAGGSGYATVEYQVGTPTFRVDSFYTTGTQTWTPPSGCTYAVATIIGAGGAGGDSATKTGSGGSSSVAFASGTITAAGGLNQGAVRPGFNNVRIVRTGPDGSGYGQRYANITTTSNSLIAKCPDGDVVRAGANVTAGVGITVVVGVGATGDSDSYGDGADGSVCIEYEVR